MNSTTLPATERHRVLGKLGGLRTELVELAFVLDRRGRPEAADVAMTLSGQLGELCEELSGTSETPGRCLESPFQAEAPE
ncbi:MAG: hypothetical protein NTV51_14205 [Verrucomicrobia bacterium]|nr:hypothetical protein [Verrucomicrobiota bacterium]